MSIFRSYFKKNNTLIKFNNANNSQNPVCEISYGTIDKQVSRFIFDVDLSNLENKIQNGNLSKDIIVKHVLHMTNTIRNAEEYVGKKSYLYNTERASSFDLEFYNINQDWDEGSGYDFSYIPLDDGNINGSNWTNAKNGIGWNYEGSYDVDKSQIIGVQHFDKGCENVTIDITEYINQRLFSSSGDTVYTGDTYGIGVKFFNVFETGSTEYRQAVAFHTKYTNSWYEPYIETIIDDSVLDDRNYFYMDNLNNLYQYLNIKSTDIVVIDKVEIYDYKNELLDTIQTNNIYEVTKGIFKIEYKVNSSEYPDSVLFKDKWFVTINGISHIITNRFYLISSLNKYMSNNNVNINNYYFTYHGINESERITPGDVRKIVVSYKELYSNQRYNAPFIIEYRMFIKLANNHEIDVIPYTEINRSNSELYFMLDTSWLIPNDYYIQLRVNNNSYYQVKENLKFTIISNSFNLI